MADSPIPIRRSARTVLLLYLFLTGFALALIQFGDLRRWNHLIYDRLSTWVFERAPAEGIVIVAVDPASLAHIGRWPWPRRIHARLLDILTEAGAKAVALDVLFAETNPSDPEGDRLLIDAVRRSGRVVLPVAPERSNGGMTMTMPFPGLASAAARLGHTDVELNGDAVVRGLFLHAGLGNPYWPTLALAILATGSADFRQSAKPGGESGGTGDSAAPVRWVRQNPVFIPYAGPAGTFRAVAFADVLEGSVDSAAFRDKYVLVGMTATGLQQRFSTPNGQDREPISGIELHANVLDGLLRGWEVRVLDRPRTMLVSASLLALAVLAYLRLFPRRELLAIVSCCLLTIALDVWLLAVPQIWFDPAATLLALLLSIPLWNWFRLRSLAMGLELEREKSAATLNSIGDGVITADAEGIIEYLNPVAESLVGIPAEAAKGRSLEEVLGTAAGRPVTDGKIEPEGLFHSPLFLSHGSGEARAVRISRSPILTPNNRKAGTVLALSDITESWRIGQEMAHMATHDSLTGLPNRVLFLDRLNQAIMGAERSGASFALLFIDLDNFKKINDGLGHALGDRVLMETGQRLRASVRKRDTVARWGGDEFVVLLENLTEAELAADVGKKILDVLAEPFHLDGPVYLSSSLGISLYPKDGTTPQALLAGADAAMYRVKNTGRNNLEFYACDMNRWARERLALEGDLRQGLDREEFELFFQPQVDPATRHIEAFEALLRWRHRDRGLVLPGTFIGLAEETGMINPLGEWAIQTACRQIRAWRAHAAFPVSVAVNLSPRQFMQKNLFEIISAAIRDNQLAPGQLTLEITENLMLNDLDHAEALLSRLRAEGVSIALDDFGTGFSSLAVLRRLPIDQIKIDKFFVKNVLDEPKDAAIARHTVELAHALDIRVVAEGIETDAQLQFFRQLGCDSVQGFFSGAPIPATAATELLKCDPSPTGKPETASDAQQAVRRETPAPTHPG